MRAGPLDAAFLREHLRKEELPFLTTRGTHGVRHNSSEALEAALGKGWHGEADDAPGQAAGVHEALRDAAARRAIDEAKALRQAREAKNAATVRNRGKQEQDNGWSGSTMLPSLVPALPGFAGEDDASLKAIRTNTGYMKVSPTFHHAGDINWFGTLGRSTARRQRLDPSQAETGHPTALFAVGISSPPCAPRPKVKNPFPFYVG
jgi:hypothetical protein